MTREQSAAAFRALAIATYGAEYKGPVAKFLAVRRDTVHEWAEGMRDIPAGIWSGLVLGSLTRSNQITEALPAAKAALDAAPK